MKKLTAIFTGLRSSELRGLRWADVNLKKGELHVRQRADRYNAIGRPKSESGERTVPLPPIVANALREWKLVCPNSELEDLADKASVFNISDSFAVTTPRWGRHANAALGLGSLVPVSLVFFADP